MPKRFARACIQRDEIALVVAGEYQPTRGSQHARGVRRQQVVSPARFAGGWVYGQHRAGLRFAGNRSLGACLVPLSFAIRLLGSVEQMAAIRRAEVEKLRVEAVSC